MLGAHRWDWLLVKSAAASLIVKIHPPINNRNNMPLFDTHCHFDFAPFADDFASHHQRALAAGVERCVVPAVGPLNWSRVAELSHYAGVYYALGFHPYFLKQQSETHFDALAALLEQPTPRCVALGECGLDFAIEVESKLQERLFIRQLELAQAYRLPLIVHCRQSDQRVLQLIKQCRFEQGGVWHGFSGSEQQAKAFIDHGFKIGVGGVITYPRANKTRRAIAALPVESLVLETDAPDMPLCGMQGQPNHPANLPRVLSALAELKQVTPEALIAPLWRSSHQLFRLALAES